MKALRSFQATVVADKMLAMLEGGLHTSDVADGIIAVTRRDGVDELVHQLAEAAVGLSHLDITEVLTGARAAALGAQHMDALKKMSRCQRSISEAERGRAALSGFAIEAKRVAGQLLAEQDPGAKGRKGKSPRRQMADAAGLSSQEANRLVKLGALEQERIASVAQELEAKGKQVTLRGVLSAVASPSSAAGYDGDQWYTGPKFLAGVRAVGGGRIDSDLTSCLLAQRHVEAKVWYSLRSPYDEDEQAGARAAGMTQAEIDRACACWGGIGGVEDGKLTQEPAGFVFGQPPYSDPAPTLRAILDGYQPGKGRLVKAAVILVNVATGTAAQQELLEQSSARLWVGKGSDNPKARMSFIAPSGEVAKANRYDQVAYYVGENPTLFASVFAGWGVVKMDGHR